MKTIFFRPGANRIIIPLTVGGVLFILAGITLLLITSTPVQAYAPDQAIPDLAYNDVAFVAYAADVIEDADYVGEGECSSCHRDYSRTHGDSRHALTLQDTSRTQDGVVADFTLNEDVRQVQFPEEDAPRAFAADDIAFAVGSGRFIQRYLYEIDRGEYAIFPAEWNVTEQVWQPYTLAENWPDAAYDWNTNCAGCHTTGLNPERGRWEDDGVQCESCHGPGSVHLDVVDDVGRNPDDEELAQIRASIIVSPDPQICGQCHGQGTEPGEGRPYPVEYRPGGVLVNDETFALVAPDDTAHWWASGHGKSQNMQYNEWLISDHATALTSVLNSDEADESCLSCHSADYTWMQRLIESAEEGQQPQPATLSTAQYGVTCASCHEVHGEGEFDYLLTDEPYALCATCHQNPDDPEAVHHPALEMFEGTQLVENVPGKQSQHFTEGAICTTCHMPDTLQTGQTWYSGSHTMALALPGNITGDQPDSCTACHDDISQDYMQTFINETQAGVEERLTDLQVAIGRDTDAPEWVRIVAAIVAGDGSLGVHNYAYTAALLTRAEQEMGVTEVTVPANITVRAVENPTECAECHENEYHAWQTSPHANASLNETFLQQFAADGRPSFCMSCHASGFDPRTEEYVFEGVTCSNCHYVTSGAEHPPGPVEVASDSAVCGQCHTGAHAPAYDEWLVSSHSTAGIDCADCHSAHDNGLKLGDVNASCGSCHEEALVDEVHMGEDMTCVDCHMTQRVTRDGVEVTELRHTLGIDPGVCADCHGNTHLLTAGGVSLSDHERQELDALHAEVLALQDTASQNLNSGIVGGAIGALVLVLVLFVITRIRRL